MSSQSGITADVALLDKVGSLLENSSVGAVVIAEISSDYTTVQLHSTLSNLQELQKFTSNNAGPFYLFIRDESGIVFVSYVPEHSAVRAKMLYASTKNTVLRQLGSNHISKQILLSSPAELVPTSWSSDTFSDNNAPLTEAEQISATISRQQESARGGRQLVSQTGGTSHTLSFKIASGDPISKLLEIYNLVVFSINLAEEQVEVMDKIDVSATSEVPKVLKVGHPTYNVYKTEENKVHFIYSCPSGSKVKERMLYASNKSGFIKHLSEVDGLVMQSISEIGDPDELELSRLIDQPTPAAQDTASGAPDRLKFDRPRRPGRRT
ncbi:LADA_0C03422g1_1 [Lachancea dasiensis]|uniref:LADA_0C03422g1_1 n=1 Tax=Lachancea dasiensis TaxID=1072105 RepID=A0A1G4IYF2_9SACH|nr:LADA_0C03422g1_1 [Lachancea dasiensis]